MAQLAPKTADFMHSITDQFADGSWLFMGFKEVGSESMRQVKVRNNFFSYSLNHDISSNSNKRTHSYVCPQAFTAKGRTEENLFALHNIVIDVDCHSERYCASLRDHRLETLARLLTHDAFSDYDLPMPSFINFTGRGLQIWWRHEPMAAYACKNTWKSIVKCFIDIINRIIADHSGPDMDVMESLTGLEVDEQASMNPVGLFRIPGTYNPTARKDSYLQECLGAESIYSYKELRQFRDDYRAERPIKRKKPTIKQRYQVPGYKWDPDSWAEETAQKIEKLRDLRDEDIGNETRNNFCVALYCLYLAAGLDNEAAMERLNTFNDGFKKPMRANEIKSTLSSAVDKQYKYSTASLIRLLDISKDEADKIGLKYIGADDNNAKKATEDAKERHKKIVHLYLTTNMTQEEVAKEIGVSRKTVGEVLREAGVNRANRKATKIQNLNEKGNSVEQIGKKVGCSNRTVYRALQNTVGKNVEGAPEAARTEMTSPETATINSEDKNVSTVVCAAVTAETKKEAETASEKALDLIAGQKDMTGVEATSEADCDKLSPSPNNNGYLPPVGMRKRMPVCAEVSAGLHHQSLSAVGIPAPATDSQSSGGCRAGSRVIGNSTDTRSCGGGGSDGGVAGIGGSSGDEDAYWGLHEIAVDAEGRKVMRRSPIQVRRGLHYHSI